MTPIGWGVRNARTKGAPTYADMSPVLKQVGGCGAAGRFNRAGRSPAGSASRPAAQAAHHLPGRIMRRRAPGAGTLLSCLPPCSLSPINCPLPPPHLCCPLQVALPFLSLEDCNLEYSGQPQREAIFTDATNTMVCAGLVEMPNAFFEQNTCYGDSGGPAVAASATKDPTKDVVVGVTSWGALEYDFGGGDIQNCQGAPCEWNGVGAGGRVARCTTPACAAACSCCRPGPALSLLRAERVPAPPRPPPRLHAAVFTNVAQLRPWIDDTMKRLLAGSWAGSVVGRGAFRRDRGACRLTRSVSAGRRDACQHLSISLHLTAACICICHLPCCSQPDARIAKAGTHAREPGDGGADGGGGAGAQGQPPDLQLLLLADWHVHPAKPGAWGPLALLQGTSWLLRCAGWLAGACKARSRAGGAPCAARTQTCGKYALCYPTAPVAPAP